MVSRHLINLTSALLICLVFTTNGLAESGSGKFSGMRLPVFHPSGYVCAELMVPGMDSEPRRVGHFRTSLNRHILADGTSLTIHTERLDASSWPQVAQLVRYLHEGKNRSGELILVRADGSRASHRWDAPPSVAADGTFVFSQAGVRKLVRALPVGHPPLFTQPPSLSQR